MKSAPPNYTPHLQAAFAAAPGQAERVGNNHVGPEHLFLAILALPQCGAVKVLTRLGLRIETVRENLESRTRPVCLGTEHILLGILIEADSLAGRALAQLGLTLEAARRAIMGETA